MSKRIHMLCNAHIDPVWQWEWEEGAAETLSTFRIAADFCEEYEDFVFCHNEALLYRWIEEYDPQLFERIRRLVKEGKWHIMGGWHLQPDCNMPSGEAFVRQIFSGRQYFQEKFGVLPTVAVNVDPFGQTRGLVQIMAKCGYTGYLFMRPWPEFLTLPAEDFRWIGYDGSSVIAVRMRDGYNSNKGQALQKIQKFEQYCGEDDFILCLWGIGNHGGGPSKKDLDDIKAHMQTLDESIELIHSTPEAYFAEVREKRVLPEFAESLNPWGPGCYTTMVNMKQKYRQAENALFMTERMCAHASAAGLMEYPQQAFEEAIYDINTIQFHDTLPGTSIQPAEEMALRFLDHALENLSRVRAKAYFALCAGQPKAEPDAIPILIYNPFPYPVEDDFSCEFNLWDQVRDFVFLKPAVYKSGQLLPTQCEKEASTIPIEWRKRVVFHATLEPMSINRFDCKFETLPQKPQIQVEQTQTHYILRSLTEYLEISKQTGLVDAYKKDGKPVLSEQAFRLDVFADDEDPWAMRVRGWDHLLGSFQTLTDDACGQYYCVDGPLPAVRVIEQGDVRTVVEAAFGYGSSRAVINYILSHTEGMQISIRVQWSEKQKLLKLHLPAAFEIQECIGEQAYGSEPLRKGMAEECCAQKYVAALGVDTAFALSNNGTYGISFDDTNHRVYPTLLRSPSYCAHPIDDRVIMPQDRFCPYTDQGERIFKFSLHSGTPESVSAAAPRRAQQFNEGVFSLSFYPTGTGSLPQHGLHLSGSNAVQLTAFKKAELGEGYILRLFNSAATAQSVTLDGFGGSVSCTLTPYEIRTFRLNGNRFQEETMLEGLI